MHFVFLKCSQYDIGDIYYTKSVFIFPWVTDLISTNFSVLEYSSSILGLPDLPSWMHSAYSPSTKFGFVFGVPPPDQPNTQVCLRGACTLWVHMLTNHSIDLKFQYCV